MAIGSTRIRSITSILVPALLLLAACGSTASKSTSTATGSPGSSSPGASPASADCGGSTKSGVTVGLVSHNAASPGIQLYKDVFKATAKKCGWTVHDVDTAGDVVAAQNQILTWVQQQVNAIVVDTIPNSGLKAAIKAANDAKIPYFSVASGAAPGVTNEVTANETKSGTQLTEAFAKALGYKGNIIKLNWTGLDATKQRDVAFHAVLAKYPNIHIAREVELKVPGWNADAYNQVTNILQSNPNIQGIWQGWDDFAPDVARAVNQAGLTSKIIIAGFDLDPAAANLLRANGPFKMTNALPIPAEARHTVAAIGTVINGGKVDPVSYVDNCLATPQNIPPTGGREQDSFWASCKTTQTS